jgi:protein TonB
MNNRLIDRLDESIDARLAGRSFAADAEFRELLWVVDGLLYLPRPAFHDALRADIVRTADRGTSLALRSEPASPVSVAKPRGSDYESIIPPLFVTGSGSLPIRGSHLAVSFALHVVALALVAASGWWMVENRTVVRTRVAQLIPGSSDYPWPSAPGKIGGGGGGGDQDKMAASRGAAPRFAAEQLTPPAVVVRNEDPKLPAEPTLIGSPTMILSPSDKYGDPMAAVLAPPSNGTGSGGGIGSGHGGGVGAGTGPGLGAGEGGGLGGGVYTVGGGVSAPRPIFDPDPEYSDEARKAKFQGNVELFAVIGPDGRPRDLRVIRSLGMGLDQKALDAVWKWRFAPAMKDGHAVAVQVSIEVAFRLY